MKLRQYGHAKTGRTSSLAPNVANFSAPARKGDWMQTFTNKQFWPLDARVEDVCIEDIAHALSRQCRFGGHTDEFYSVAQHSCLVASHCSYENRLAGLLHDATEAYLVDVPSPIKPYLSEYKGIETNLARVIGEAFGVELAVLPVEVHEQDARALFTEKRDLRGPTPAPWRNPVDPWDSQITTWSTKASERTFLHMFSQLRRK